MFLILLAITENAASAAVDTPLLVIADAMALFPSATDFFNAFILLFISPSHPSSPTHPARPGFIFITQKVSLAGFLFFYAQTRAAAICR